MIITVNSAAAWRGLVPSPVHTSKDYSRLEVQMPYKDKITGIYEISTPNGSRYVGSSVNIYSRWSGHRTDLRRNKHHSTRLQAAFDKHGDSLEFKILFLCDRDDLNKFEQMFIDYTKPALNTMQFISNVWANQETREKFNIIHSSEKWKKERSEIASRPNSKWRKVESSDGICFQSMGKAAVHYGTTASHIKLLAETQTISISASARFRFVGEEWTEAKTQYEKTVESRKGYKHSEETKAKFREQRKNWKPTKKSIDASIEVNSVAVIGTSMKTGEKVKYSSQREAARLLRPNNPKTASSQICKAISGVKNNAYGYTWGKA